MEPKRVRARNWCFTINNPEEGWTHPTDPEVRYCVYQKEVGEKGTPHIQGYIEMFKAYGIQRMKTFLKCSWVHLECRRGTQSECRAYCTKSETRMTGTEPTEYGTPASESQGARSDLSLFCDRLKNNEPIVDIAMDHPETYVKYNRGLEKLHSLLAKPRTEATEVIVIWGDTGLGKSRMAQEMMPNGADGYHREWTSLSFDGRYASDYRGEPVVWIDEFAPHQMTREVFLRLTDMHPCELRILGAYVNWNPRLIVITSNIPPAQWYYGTFGNEEVLRRLTKVIYLRKDGTGTKVEVGNTGPPPDTFPQNLVL